MTPNKPGRGRPKGTGLNDELQLKAIASLMAADPELKPTTAIKALGISDPSVIRRLRDKYQAAEASLMAEMKGATGSRPETLIIPASTLAASACPPPAKEPAPSTRVVALAGARERRKSAPAVARTPSAQTTAVYEFHPRPSPARAIPLPSETELPRWMGVGLSIYALSVEAQFAVAGAMFQWPQFAAVLRSQVAFTELAITLTQPFASMTATSDG